LKAHQHGRGDLLHFGIKRRIQWGTRSVMSPPGTQYRSDGIATLNRECLSFASL
jgi:hypothetical protein